MITKTRIALLSTTALGAVAAIGPAAASANGLNVAVCGQADQPCSGTIGVSITQTQTQDKVSAKTDDVSVDFGHVTVSPSASNGNQIQVNKVNIGQSNGITLTFSLHHH